MPMEEFAALGLQFQGVTPGHEVESCLVKVGLLGHRVEFGDRVLEKQGTFLGVCLEFSLFEKEKGEFRELILMGAEASTGNPSHQLSEVAVGVIHPDSELPQVL